MIWSLLVLIGFAYIFFDCNNNYCLLFMWSCVLWSWDKKIRAQILKGIFVNRTVTVEVKWESWCTTTFQRSLFFDTSKKETKTDENFKFCCRRASHLWYRTNNIRHVRQLVSSVNPFTHDFAFLLTPSSQIVAHIRKRMHSFVMSHSDTFFFYDF